MENDIQKLLEEQISPLKDTSNGVLPVPGKSRYLIDTYKK